MRGLVLFPYSQAIMRIALALTFVVSALARVEPSRAAPSALRVLHSTPAAGATGVPATGFISLTFDRPIVSLSDVGVAGARTPATITPAVSGQGRWINTSIWTYQAPGGLALATRYQVTTHADVASTDGSRLPGSYSFAFETLRPSVLSVTPVSGTQYALPRDDVQIVFNQPVQHKSAEAAFSMKAAGSAVNGHFTWNDALLATQPNGSAAKAPSGTNNNSDATVPPPAPDTIMTYHVASPMPLGASVSVTEDAGVLGTGGPLPMAQPYSWAYAVTKPLSVVSSDPASGSTTVDTANGIKLTLSAPVMQDVIQKAVHVSPKLDYVYVYLDDTATTVTVNGDFLPSTHYSISIDRRALGTANQALAAAYSLNFTTRAAVPSLSLISQGPGAVYNEYLGTNIYANVVNMSSISLNLYKLSAAQFSGLLFNPPNNWDGTAPSGVPRLTTWQLTSRAALNSTFRVRQPLVVGGQPIPPGYYLVNAWNGAGVPAPNDHLLVLVTRTSVTLKIGQHQAFVWATDLKTGKPVLGESVRVVDKRGHLWASGTTNGDGIFQATVHDLKSSDSLLQHTLIAQLTHGSDVAAASLDWNSGVGPWDYELPFTSYLQPVRLYVNTERPIYKPGQPIFFKGIARQDNDGRYATPATGKPVDVTFQDGQQNTIYKTRLHLDRFGAFNGKLTLSPSARLGNYSLSAAIGVSSGNAYFQVSAYKKPSYAVTVISDRGQNANYSQGERIGVQVRANYFFGAPLAGAPVQWDLTENDFTFSSSLFPEYAFGQNDYANTNQQLSNGQQVTQGSGKTDSHGDFHFTVPANIKSSPVSQQYTLEAILTGPDNQQVAENTQVVVHKSTVYVGIQPANYLATAGKANPIRLVTVADDDLHVAAGVPITVRIYKRVWLSGFVRDSNGFFFWQDRHKDTLVSTYKTHSNSQGKTAIDFVPKDGGEYLAVVTATDPAGRSSVSSLSLWAISVGQSYVPWQTQNNDRIKLVADKATYKPGDTARILVTAPLAGVTALVTVERGAVLSHKLVTLPTNSSTISLPILGYYAPNIYVSVTLVKGPGKDTSIPVWKMGYVSLPVDVSARSLHVALKASTTKAKPGQQVTFDVHATDSRGHGVQAQFAVALVDKAVLSLAASGNPDLMDTFYTERDLGVESAASLTLYIDRLNLNQKVGSKGGSGGGGAQGPTRINFPDTAYWNPAVVTDANGNAKVTFTLPDNLTTWTFTAIGGTASTLVGQNSMDLLSTKDLLLEPALPRFLTLGDTATGGAVVNNLTGATQHVHVTLHAGGSGAGVDYHSTVDVAAGGSQLVQWPITATAIGTQTFLFTAQSTTNAALGDRLQVSLPVQENSIPVVAATSELFRTSITQTVNIPAGTIRNEGDLSVTLTPSLVSGLNQATDYLAQYPYDSAEQTSSAMYGLVEALRLPRSLSGLSAATAVNAPLMVSSALQRLYGFQNRDGGWGWWPEDLTDPYVSAWVLDGLLTAKSAGYTVDAKVLKSAIGYARNWALKPASANSGYFSYLADSTYTLDLQAYVAYVLGRAGAPDSGLAGTLYARRQNMLPFARAYLALVIAQQSSSQDQRVRVLLSDIAAAAHQFDNQAHWSDKAPDWLMMEDSVSATAVILQTLVRIDPKNPLALASARWLLSQRRDGAWDSTQSTARAIAALVDYATQTQPATGSSSFSIQVNGKTIASGTVTDTNRGVARTFSVPLTALGSTSTAKVTLQQRGGGGAIAYNIALHSFQAVQSVPAVEHGISVSRQYQAVDGSHGQAGSQLRVVLTVTAPEDLYYLRIEDPLPAGAEPVDPSLLTTSVLSGITSQTTIPKGTTNLAWYISHTELRDDRAALFADFLPAGTYQYNYQIHLTSAGKYHALPTQAYMLYFPDVFGHGPGKIYTITPH